MEIWQFQSGISWESFLGQPGIVDKGGMSNTDSELLKPLWLWDVERADSALYILFNQRIYNFIRAGFNFQVEINHFYYWKLLDTHITAKHPRVFFFAFLERKRTKGRKKI